MSGLIKPGEDPIATRVIALEDAVRGMSQLLGLMDQYLLMNKKFFDQIKVNEKAKTDEVKDAEIIKEK